MARSKSRPRKGGKANKRRGRKLGSTGGNKRNFSTTNSKSSTVRAPKKARGGGSFAPHHAVRMRPFSTATSQPKIPDGELTSSLSRRLQNIKEITNGLNQKTMHVFFSPSLGVPLVVSHTQEGTDDRPSSSSKPSFIGFPGQNVGFQVQSAASNTPTWPIVADGDYHIKNLSSFAKWRIVSQGLRMELNSTAEENNGWFEAIRFNWRRHQNDLSFTPLDGGKTTNLLGVCADPEQLVDRFKGFALVEQPGYKTGLLKDIHKYEFALHPQSSTHDPVNLDDSWDITTPTDFGMNGDKTTLDAIDGSLVAGRIMDQTVDPNMDWIYIKIHPRQNTASAGNNGSALIMNVVQNLEMAFNPESDFASFQTTNKKDKKTGMVADTLNNNPDAMGTRRK